MADRTSAPARARCWWAESDPLLVDYHDREWGRPVADDARLFEMLSLEGFQAGLSWLTILRKRESFRTAFRGFDPAAVAAFTELDTDRLLADPGIVRNRAKIEATIGNAAAVLEIVAEHGSLAAYLAAQAPARGPLPSTAGPSDIPATTPVSDALSRDLRRHGLRFVGSTIVYSFMQAVGLVDDHLPACFHYRVTG